MTTIYLALLLVAIVNVLLRTGYLRQGCCVLAATLVGIFLTSTALDALDALGAL